jgi:hypothetical protein
MSTFADTTVSDVVRMTAKMVERVSGKSNPDPLKYVLLPEGFYVTQQLYDFTREVRKVFPQCKFGHSILKAHVVSLPWNGYEMPIQVHEAVSVYFSQDVYALGDIMYRDFPKQSGYPTENNYKYGVYSRLIRNEKFRVSSSGYHTKTSDNVNVALRAVKQFFRSYKLHEMADLEAYSFRKAVTRRCDKLFEAYDKSQDLILNNSSARDALWKEVKNMIKTGYQFADLSLREKCATWVSDREAFEEEKNREVPAVFVHVSVQRDKQVFDVMQVPNAKNSNQPYKDLPCQRYYENDLPESYMGKLSVLSLLKVGDYSSGVGKRVDETIFWLEV